MRRIFALAAVALLCAAPAATASGGKDDSRKLRERVTVRGILAHEVALVAALKQPIDGAGRIIVGNRFGKR